MGFNSAFKGLIITPFFIVTDGLTRNSKKYSEIQSRNCILTYSLHGAVLLKKVIGLQLVKKFPAFHGTRSFITAFTSVHHLSLSWASPIQSIYPHPTSEDPS